MRTQVLLVRLHKSMLCFHKHCTVLSKNDNLIHSQQHALKNKVCSLDDLHDMLPFAII